MTLHITMISGAFVVQVGDRLLSTQRGPTFSDWDPYANKSVFVEALNGRVAVSYAGLAHINGDPTDQWLVETITGEKAPQPIHPGAGPPTRVGGPIHITLGEMMHDLEAAILRDFTRQSERQRRAGLKILISGWTWPHDVNHGNARPRTFGRVLSHSGNPRSSVKTERAPAMTYVTSAPSFALAAIGAVPEGLIRDLQAELLGVQHNTGDSVEASIVSAIRRAATPGSGIGTELMSISIPISSEFDPRIRYFRDTSLTRPNAAYSPAFASVGGMIVYPTVITGSGVGFSYGEDGIINIECIPPLDEVPGPKYMFSQPRRRPGDPAPIVPLSLP